MYVVKVIRYPEERPESLHIWRESTHTLLSGLTGTEAEAVASRGPNTEDKWWRATSFEGGRSAAADEQTIAAAVLRKLRSRYDAE